MAGIAATLLGIKQEVDLGQLPRFARGPSANSAHLLLSHKPCIILCTLRLCAASFFSCLFDSVFCATFQQVVRGSLPCFRSFRTDAMKPNSHHLGKTTETTATKDCGCCSCVAGGVLSYYRFETLNIASDMIARNSGNVGVTPGGCFFT